MRRRCTIGEEGRVRKVGRGIWRGRRDGREGGGDDGRKQEEC